jgi:cob(I)alamin adenosyltransferase
MGIVTKTGDDGTTGISSGKRFFKDDPRIEALGKTDELSSLLGFARLECALVDTRGAIESLQRDLARVAGELASIEPPFANAVKGEDEAIICEAIGALEDRLGLKGFVLPGRTEGSARLDLARVAARELERRVVSLSRLAGPAGEAGVAEVSPILRRYLNRLSDYLFLLARSEEDAKGKIEYV